MTALLELKQKIKNLYGQNEIYILPVLKFGLALAYFFWIRDKMGYMSQLNNIIILLILALICSIMPPAVTIFVGFVLMVGHAYALGIETAGFFLVLILFLLVLFLRFSAGSNIVLVFTPLSFTCGVPALLPIGCGLLSGPASSLPAGCGIIIYYFVRFVRAQASYLSSPDVIVTEKLKFIADGLVQNWGMWITIIAFIATILTVNLIRTRSFDYAWRIAILVGGVIYILVLLAAGYVLDITFDIVPMLIYTAVSVLVGIVLEFFVFGGDYSRTERLEYEDDEYYYYVKAVPKAAVAATERSIKKINAEPGTEEKVDEEKASSYANPIFHGDDEQSAPRSEAPVSRKKKWTMLTLRRSWKSP